MPRYATESDRPVPFVPAAAEPERVIVFDTTLRDGEQSPGCSMSPSEKLRVARALAALQVDVLEAGFPIASDGDLEAVRAIARQVEGPAICALARCLREDIERAWEGVRDAARPRIHVFLATSALHREHKLGLSRAQVVACADEGVRRARDLCADVEFSPEDASRTEPDFLAEVVERAIAAGATTINVPDTVGYSLPDEYRSVFERLRAGVRGIERAVLSAHCHDDLGLAVANSLAAIRGGARQVECTINGIGERAGNCALEELVMAIRTRRDELGVSTGVDTTRLCPTSRLVAAVTGSPVQRNKAVVGENAFAHEAGIHQHGVLRERRTYEIMDPRDVGFETSRLVLGKHSGRHAVRARVERLGYQLGEAELERVVQAVKALADKKKTVYDSDLEAILFSRDPVHEGPWRLAALRVSGGTDGPATATVRLVQVPSQSEVVEAAVGNGPVHAVFEALVRATGVRVSLRDYQVHSVGAGEDAQGEAILDLAHGGETLRGRGLSTDVVEASGLAVLDVLNRILRRQGALAGEAAIPAAARNAAAALNGRGPGA